MELLALLLLAFVPFIAWRYARARAPRHIWLVTGVAFGLVASPLSLGLYSTYFLSPFGFPTGMLGLASSFLHGPPGYYLAIWLRLVPSNEVVAGASHVFIEVLNGVVWGALYGFLGFLIDSFRLRARQRVA